MARNPFQQLRVLTQAANKGTKLTDCYRLLFRVELWCMRDELSPELSKAVAQCILQLQKGTFRFGEQEGEYAKHEVLLVKLIYKVLIHAFPFNISNTPQTILKFIQTKWHHVHWCIVGSITPDLTPMYLLKAMERRINDRRFLLLLHHLLHSKIMNWAKQNDEVLYTKIVVLFEKILLNEWDCFLEKQMKMVAMTNTNKECLGKEINAIRFNREIIVGFCGSKREVLHFNKNVREFIETHLSYRYDLRVTHLQNRVEFAGFELRKRNETTHISLNISTRAIVQFARMKGYGSYTEFLPQPRKSLLHLTEGHIMSIYNNELRRLATYFAVAENNHKLSKLFHLAKASFLMTLACKQNTTTAKMAKRVKKYEQGKICVLDDQNEFISFVDMCEFESK